MMRLVAFLLASLGVYLVLRTPSWPTVALAIGLAGPYVVCLWRAR
jgi:hypothetical protein